jgi:5-methyltetrahydropteroyltriglutamate--homocysteine methyltransferase
MTLPLLPTTMVGSYPRPAWFTYQLDGRDIREAFKLIHHQEAYQDATRTVIKDQENAGLDLLADGQMWFDDYGMGIGSFLWYWLERIEGFGREKLPHPARAKARGTDVWAIDEAGGVAARGPLQRGPIRMAELYRIAQANTERPIKACIGAGPVQLSTLAHFQDGPIKDRYQLSHALAEIFRAEIAELVAAGSKYVQLEDLGAWMPSLSGEKDFAWVRQVVDRTMAGIPADVHTSWHFCLGNAWGNRLHGMTKGGYRAVLREYLGVGVQQFVLDYACREMEDIELLAELPEDKSVAVGVIDVRSLEVEQAEQVAERIRKVIKVVPAERVMLTTDCGMKQLPRPCAREKLRSLVAGAHIVRRELSR